MILANQEQMKNMMKVYLIRTRVEPNLYPFIFKQEIMAQKTSSPIANAALLGQAGLNLKWENYPAMMECLETPEKRERLVAYCSIHGFSTTKPCFEFLNLLMDEKLLYSTHTNE